MKCNVCLIPVDVTHSHSGTFTRASRAVCPKCGKVFTIAAAIFESKSRGEGAKAVARQLAAGSKRLELLDEVSSPEEVVAQSE